MLALRLRTLSPEALRHWVMALALLSPACFCALVALTGGQQSPMFHWILAVPLTVAVVIQDHARATLVAGIATVLGGIAVLVSAGAGETVLPWSIQAAGMAGLAYYASAVYQRLHARDRQLRFIERTAFENNLLLEAERKGRLKAEELVQAREAFLSVASHELRTPLTSLRLQLERLAALGVEATPETVERPIRQVDRLNRLVDQLLDTSQLVSGHLAIDRELLDLGELAKGVATDLEGRASSIQVTVDAETRGSWDRLRLERVVTNLIDNAMKYGEGRPIELHVKNDGEFVKLAVRDHGIGIAPADQSRIFSRFERAVSHRNYSGFGIGLWVVTQIVQALGGTIRVESNLGVGSTFEVRLPRAA